MLGRRIAQAVTDLLLSNTETTRYVYDGFRVIEERGSNDELMTPGNDDLLAEFLFGNYIDDVLQMRRYDFAGSSGARRDYNYLRDDQYSIIALQLFDGSANPIVERVRYDAFGKPTFINEQTGTETSASQYGNTFAFQGRKWDALTRLYHYRLRAYDPATGQFLQKDPIGIWGDLINRGNGYTFVGNGPWDGLDPIGLQSIPVPTNCADPVHSSSSGLNRRGSVLGKLWTSPNTVVGVTYGLTGTVYGTGLSLVSDHPKPRIDFGANDIQFINNPLFVDKGRALSFGNTTQYPTNSQPDDRASRYDYRLADPNATTADHETGHTYDWERWGPFFLPKYILGELTRKEGEVNPLEKLADDHADEVGRNRGHLDGHPCGSGLPDWLDPIQPPSANPPKAHIRAGMSRFHLIEPVIRP